jgi:transposase InsO family protein
VAVGAVKAQRRYSASEKQVLLGALRQAQGQSGQALRDLRPVVGVPRATYYRWQAREAAQTLQDRIVTPRRQVVWPTPDEVQAVRTFALQEPTMGYKRLAWRMVDAGVACLRPYQVLAILREANLLRRQAAPDPPALRRPREAERPDQTWHTDLMYLHIAPRWYYLIDVLDAYSRYLVHWKLLTDMRAESVTEALQEALEKLAANPPPELYPLHPGEPALVHDSGCQFVGVEWRRFIAGSGQRDIRTRVAHPQSNGRVERLHRTHREEGLALAPETYAQAVEQLARWADYYNGQRPHSALGYLCPLDYYRGDPALRREQREAALAQAALQRQSYWADQKAGVDRSPLL